MSNSPEGTTKIRAISIYQPWASLIAIGAKRYETRSWSTSYRGPLLIYAAKGGLPKKKLQHLLLSPPYFEVFFEFFGSKFISGDFDTGWQLWIDHLYLGQVVAVADLVDIYRICEQFRGARTEQELLFGDYTLGRYAWKLEHVRAIDPFPVKGRRRLFEVEIDKERLAAVPLCGQ